jgi:hypothetical protein
LALQDSRIAKESSSTLYQKFLEYYEDKDFSGIDMVRKFIQMGMTRAKCYANYKVGGSMLMGRRMADKLRRARGMRGRRKRKRRFWCSRRPWENVRLMRVIKL